MWIVLAFQSKRILSFLVLPLLACLLVWGLLRRSGSENGRWPAVERQPWRAEIVVESSPSSLLPSQASHGGLAAASEKMVREPSKATVSRVEEGSEGVPLSDAGKKEQEKVVERLREATGDGDDGLPDRGQRKKEAGDGVDGSNGERTADSNGEMGKEDGDGGKGESRGEGNGEGSDGLKVGTDVKDEGMREKGDGDGQGEEKLSEATQMSSEGRQDENVVVESEGGSRGVGEKGEEERKEEKRGIEVEEVEKKEGKREEEEKEKEKEKEKKGKEEEETEKKMKGKEKEEKEKGKGKGKKKGKKRQQYEEVKEKVHLDVPADCDLYHGTWQPDLEPPLYTNNTCAAISQHQNCQGNGRPDSGYERWRWRPGGREECGALPRFDAVEFMHVMRGKSVLFVGDSVARNHMESLICLLSQVETPHLRGSKSLIRMVFPRAKLTIARIWSAWLVHESPDPPPSALPSAPADLPRLHLDRTGEKWWGGVERYDVVVLCTGHWFVKPALFVVGGRVVGSQGGWWEAHGKELEGVGGGESGEETRGGAGGGEGGRAGGGGGGDGSGKESGSEGSSGQLERKGGESSGQEQQGEQRRRLEGRVVADDTKLVENTYRAARSSRWVTDTQKDLQKDTRKDTQVPVNNTAAFSIAIRTVFADVAAAVKANPKQLFVFRTYSPDHYEGGQWNTGGSCAGLAEPRGSGYTYENTYGNAIYNEQKAAYNKAMEGLGEDYKWRFGLMDIMPSAGLRVDGHPGPYRRLNSVAELEKRREEDKEAKYPPPAGLPALVPARAYRLVECVSAAADQTEESHGAGRGVEA
ncbi:unnamed protein product [Closterium sp. NIES-64]|nr:unnamed protein product [Closterium sp. NIES-64]